MHVGNSPFFQKPKDDDVKKHGGKSLAQLYNLTKKIEEGIPSGAIYVGYGAEEIQATSSGQITSMQINLDSEEIYASWIGEALAIGVSGAMVMLIDEPEVLTALFEGWNYYRKYLEQTPNLKDKQIETWNGNWLSHRFDKKFDTNNPLNNFQIAVTEVQGNIAIPTLAWSKVIFALAKKYPKKIITAYAYNLSQTNTTLGFINLFLPEVRRLFEIRDALFIDESDSILNSQEIESLETFYNFRNACKIGTIGLKALEPEKLRDYMPKGSMLYSKGLDFKFIDDNSYHIYQLYKIWIIAMLNKTELLQIASEVAKALVIYEANGNKDNRGKKDKEQDANKVKDAKNVRDFIESLTEILEKEKENGEIFKNAVAQILIMPVDNFPLFATLVRFEYTYLKTKN